MVFIVYVSPIFPWCWWSWGNVKASSLSSSGSWSSLSRQHSDPHRALQLSLLTPSPLVSSWGARSAEEDVTVVTTQDNSGADLNQLGDIKPSDPMWMIWNKRNLWSMLLVINLVKWVFPLPVVSLSIVMPGLAVFVLLDKQSETQDSDQASRGCQHRSDHS